MSTATLSHQPLKKTRASRTAASDGTAAAQQKALTYAEQDAHDTKVIAGLAGAAALIILVFWIGMMWWLSGYGPVA